MKHERVESALDGPVVCRYPGSRLNFRAPQGDLTAPRLVCLGGSETFGRFLPRAYPERVAEVVTQEVINFGVVNAGIDSFLKDPMVLDVCREASLVVIEALGAQNLSNRFYTVHSRRNDRFVGASEAMRRLFPGIDFSQMSFTGHLIETVKAKAPDRFQDLVRELQIAWVARMQHLVERIGPHVHLLWLSERSMHGAGTCAPKFVTGSMVDEIAPVLHGVTEVVITPQEARKGRQDLILGTTPRSVSETMLGSQAQMRAAEAVLNLLDLSAT